MRCAALLSYSVFGDFSVKDISHCRGDFVQRKGFFVSRTVIRDLASRNRKDRAALRGNVNMLRRTVRLKNEASAHTFPGRFVVLNRRRQTEAVGKPISRTGRIMSSAHLSS